MIIMDLVVVGTPKPKGSLKHVGKGRLIEQVQGSKPWKETISLMAKRNWGGQPPHDGPVLVEATVYVSRPKSAKNRALPTTRSSGDIDKHARNILDALSDAGVYVDDSQVVTLIIRKRHTTVGENPGCRIVVTTHEETQNGCPVH
jgi:crossover junction endodeoxyribonuclease RusA